MGETPEDVLNQLSTIIMDLGAIRERAASEVDRAAVRSQIKALSKWWRKIDDERAGQSDQEIADAAAALKGISEDLKKEKKKLGEVAKVIHRAAQAIGIAEKVFKKIAGGV